MRAAAHCLDGEEVHAAAEELRHRGVRHPLFPAAHHLLGVLLLAKILTRLDHALADLIW